MRAALARHGVDGGLWCEGGVGMGQVLLPFTPQDDYERQPVRSQGWRLTLVGDVRLDNRSELLSGPSVGTVPQTASCSLKRTPGGAQTACSHLTGVFAFAVWDARTQSLFAARSPIVAPSLVYTADARSFAFATMPSGSACAAASPARAG